MRKIATSSSSVNNQILIADTIIAIFPGKQVDDLICNIDGLAHGTKPATKECIETEHRSHLCGLQLNKDRPVMTGTGEDQFILTNSRLHSYVPAVLSSQMFGRSKGVCIRRRLCGRGL